MSIVKKEALECEVTKWMDSSCKVSASKPKFPQIECTQTNLKIRMQMVHIPKNYCLVDSNMKWQSFKVEVGYNLAEHENYSLKVAATRNSTTRQFALAGATLEVKNDRDETYHVLNFADGRGVAIKVDSPEIEEFMLTLVPIIVMASKRAKAQDDAVDAFAGELFDDMFDLGDRLQESKIKPLFNKFIYMANINISRGEVKPKPKYDRSMLVYPFYTLLSCLAMNALIPVAMLEYVLTFVYISFAGFMSLFVPKNSEKKRSLLAEFACLVLTIMDTVREPLIILRVRLAKSIFWQREDVEDY